MAASSAALANAALAHLGVAGAIVTLSSDTTTAGKACREFYPRARQETLAAHPWTCAKKQATLTLAETFADTAEREWLYRYRLPEDCLTPRRLVIGIRNPAAAEQEMPFELAADTDSTTYDAATTYAAGDYALSANIWYRALRTTVADTPASSTSDWVALSNLNNGPPKFLDTDQADAILEYTMDLTDTTRFDPALESAIIAKLAYYVVPAVTVNGSAAQLRNDVAALWNHLLGQARADDYNARKRDVPAMGGYRLARNRGRTG